MEKEIRERLGIDPDTNGSWNGARNWRPAPVDPLALDLDGDGLETVGIDAYNTVVFDHDGDGIRTGTGWVKGDDGFLALDRNGNGVIDSGRELFGNHTELANGQSAADGYSALADLDSNGDGVISSLDALFEHLRVWRDLNQNGVSDAGELTSLANAGIASIDLTHASTNLSRPGGNVQTAQGSFTRTDGTTGTAGNLNLVENVFYRQFTDPVELTDAARTLPGLHGSGQVRDLREAASLDGQLVSDIDGLANLSRSQMRAALDGLIDHWADTSTMPTSIEQAAEKNYGLIYLIPGMSLTDWFKIHADSATVVHGGYGGGGGGGNGGYLILPSETEAARLAALDAEQQRVTHMISVLERFNGQGFVDIKDESITHGNGSNTPVAYLNSQASWNTWTGGILLLGQEVTRYASASLTAAQITLLEQSYSQLKESIYGGLVLQTRLQGYLDEIELIIDETGIRLDYSGLEARFDALYAADPVKAFADALDLTLYGQELGWNAAQKLMAWMDQAEAGGQLDALKAGLAAEFTVGVDFKRGTDANETLNGGVSHDLLQGGGGNDTLNGGAGADTYLFGIGSGSDTIDNNDTDALGVQADTIQFGEGLTPDQIILDRSSDDLMIRIRGTNDQLRVVSYFRNGVTSAYAVEYLRFADGTVWNIEAVKERVLVGTAGHDILTGREFNETIHGGDGNDTLDGGAGDDILNGGNGNDTLLGGDGNDTLIDGSGYNVLDGGNGNDTLTGRGRFIGGQGNDVMTATDYGSADTYVFNLGDGQDTINDYGHYYYHDWLLFGEGIDPETIQLIHADGDLLIQINDNDSITIKNWFASGIYHYIERFQFADGTEWNLDTVRNRVMNVSGTEGDDTLNGWDGRDVLQGLGGNDTLNGGAGNDIYLFGRGDGQDTITDSSGSDLLRFGPGIGAEDLWFRHVGNALEVSVIGTEDKVTVNNWYSNSAYRVERFEVSGGEALLVSQVENLIQAMAAFAPPSPGESSLPPDYQEALAPVIAANWQATA